MDKLLKIFDLSRSREEEIANSEFLDESWLHLRSQIQFYLEFIIEDGELKMVVDAWGDSN